MLMAAFVSPKWMHEISLIYFQCWPTQKTGHSLSLILTKWFEMLYFLSRGCTYPPSSFKLKKNPLEPYYWHQSSPQENGSFCNQTQWQHVPGELSFLLILHPSPRNVQEFPKPELASWLPHNHIVKQCKYILCIARWWLQILVPQTTKETKETFIKWGHLEG